MPSAPASARSALVVVACALGLAAPAAAQRRRPPRRPPAAAPVSASASANAAPAPAAPAAPVTLDALLRRFAALPGLHARFREEKRVQLLAAPLVSEGTVDYAPPSRMARHTTSPSASSVLIDGAQLRFGDARGQQSIDMNAAPVVRQFVDSFVAVVAGDRAAIERSYEADFRVPDPARPDAWELTLRPRTPAVQRVFRDIAMRGDGVVLARLTLRETNGDETVTTFTDVDPARRYTPDDLARVFRVGAR